MNYIARIRINRIDLQYIFKAACTILLFLWVFIISSFILIDKPKEQANLSIPYIPQSVQIPTSVYNLAQFITNHNVNVPSIPIEIIDPYLNILSVRASRLRSSGSATFIISTENEILNSDYWCLFDDASITPVYTFYKKISRKTIFFFECSLPDSIIQRLWYNRITDQQIKIFLATSRKILAQGFLNIPWLRWAEDNEQSLTLCTHSLHYSDLSYFIQWINFHRLVGISKIAIYNISNVNNDFESVVNMYEEEYPGLIDIIPWNNSIDEIQYDCFLHYGDISEWIAVIDMNEYLIPKFPYYTLPKLLSEQYGRNLQTSVVLENQEFCTGIQQLRINKKLVIEKYVSRHIISNRPTKYLYRPRSINFLSIHQDSSKTKSAD